MAITSTTEFLLVLGLNQISVSLEYTLYNITDQAWVSEGMKVHHVTQAAISQGRTKDGNMVSSCPIADAVFVVDFCA